MARPSKHDAATMLDAAAALLVNGGPAAVTIPAVSAATGAPSGSIYHRFGSRDRLLAQLWLRTVGEFQRGYLDALADPDLDAAALRAAAHVVTWSRDHTEQAMLLLLHRRSQLAAQWPDDLGAELATLDDAVARALRDHATRRGTSIERTTFALVHIPYAACRGALAAGHPPSHEALVLVDEAVRHLLGIDRERRVEPNV